MRTLADVVRRSIRADTFPALLERLHAERYTGTVVFCFGEGVPTHAEFPSAPHIVRLDKGPRLSTELTASVDSRGSRRGSIDIA